MSHTGRGFFMKKGRHELTLCFADPLSIRTLTRINNEAQRMFLIPAIRSVGGARHTLSHRSLLDITPSPTSGTEQGVYSDSKKSKANCYYPFS